MSSIQDLICLDEVYFGKTPDIVQMENQLRLVRHKYYDKPKYNPTEDPDLAKFNRMVENFFGFGCFALIIEIDPIPSTLSIPVDFSFSAARRANNFIVNDKTYKFKKEFKYTCIIAMTTGLFSNKYFSTGEVMACILYELGHNFYSCLERNNGILSGIYSATLWAEAITNAIDSFTNAKLIADTVNAGVKKVSQDRIDMAKADIIAMSKFGKEQLKNPDFIDYVNFNKQVEKKITTAMTAGLTAPVAADVAKYVYDNSIDYLLLVKDLKKQVKENNNFTQIMYNWKDYLGYALGYLGIVKDLAYTTLGRLISSGQAINIANVIKGLSGEIFLPYKTLIDNAKNPLTWIMLPLGYAGERGADNFPTMYGYSAEAISYSNKVNSLKNNKATRNIVKKAPFIGIMYDAISAPAKILNGVFDPKPDGIAMSYDQIKMLRRELRKQSLDEKMRQTLEEDLELCEKQLKKLTDTSRGVKDPDYLKHLYNRILGDVADGMGIKERIFDNAKKFRNYDAQVKRKYQESTMDNMIEDWMVVDEGTIDTIKQKLTTEKELRDQWSKVAKSFVKHHWITRHINEKQREMLDKYYKMLTDDETSYQDYQKGFRAICKFMGINHKEVIIEHLLFQHDSKDPDQPIVALNYSKGLAKVTLPEGIRLVHISPVDNIKALEPSFRSKVKGKYMYPSKRVFFTIKKDINPVKAGLKGTKTYRYTPTADIRTAYIDPTYADYGSGFVYVETDKSIPVQKWDRLMDKVFSILNKKKETSKDNIKDDHGLDESVIDEDYNNAKDTDTGCISFFEDDVEDYDFFEESVLSDFLQSLRTWKTSNQAHSKKVFKSNVLTDEEYNKLDELIGIMKTEEDYSEYKKAFDKFCYFCHIVPRGTILCKYELKKGKESGRHSIYVEYSENTKKIDIPQDLSLFHMTTVAGIKELLPFFRGKSQKGYLYDKPRIYLTVHQNMPRFLADYKSTDKLHKYKVKSSVKSAYVDPLVWANIQGAMYIETNKPLPVEEVGKKPEGNQNTKFVEDETSKHDQSKFKDSEVSKRTDRRVTYSQTTQGNKQSKDLEKAVRNEEAFIDFCIENGLILEYYSEDDTTDLEWLSV